LFTRNVVQQLLEGVKLTLEDWKRCGTPDITEKGVSQVVIESSGLKYQTEPEARSGLKVSVKIFTYSESCSIFTDALHTTMQSLGVEAIDSLTLCLPPSRSKGSIEEMKSIWTCAVGNVSAGRIKDLGVSDLNAEQLKELYAWAEDIKPTTNQVNLDACCVIPPELNDFAKDKRIRLLTHNDPRDILPQNHLILLLKEANFPDPESWSVLWAARYSVLVTGNGVIEAKGYIVSLLRI
jgi:glutamate--cysteine ligase regulatory subunit